MFRGGQSRDREGVYDGLEAASLSLGGELQRFARGACMLKNGVSTDSASHRQASRSMHPAKMRGPKLRARSLITARAAKRASVGHSTQRVEIHAHAITRADLLAAE
jgi:hypothetical protein